MAVKINLTDGNGSKTQDFRQDNTPATQGNVINTLNAYNEKIKKEYYDKTQARADENALQKSIQNIVKLLAKSAWNDTVTIPENTTSEDTDNDRLKSYSGSFGEDNEKTFDEAGLVQKINIIANIISGNTDDEKQWKENVYGNNIGAGESTLNVPVIGITRENPEYTAEFKTEGENRTLTISGLNKTKIVRPNGEDYTNDVSEITVLSEKQVAEMICRAVESVLGGFDSQIANIVSYLLFQEGDLPDSYKFVLNHTTDDGIKSAPLYVTYEDDSSNIGKEYTGPAYYIHDLNGDIKETVEYVINKDNIGSLRNEGYKPTNSNFTLKADGELNKINVSYNNDPKVTYSLDVPKKTVTLNLHENPKDEEKVSYKCELFQEIIGSGYFEFTNGIAYKNFPQGSIVTITMPYGFKDTLFYEEDYDDNGMKELVVDLSKNDAHIYNKKLTFNIKDKETLKQLVRIPQLAYIQQLERVQNININNLKITNHDYTHFSYLSDVIIYLDPPYEKAHLKGYSINNFDSKAFYDWAYEMSKKNIVLISSYETSDKRFECVYEFKTVKSTFAPNKKSGDRTEKLFMVKKGVK